MLVEGVLLLALDGELLLVLVLLEVVGAVELEEVEVDDLVVELVLVEAEAPLTVLYVEQLLALVLLEVVDDLEVEEVDEDDVEVELVLVEEVPVILLLVELLDVEVALGLGVDVPVESVLLEVVGRGQVVEDQSQKNKKNKKKHGNDMQKRQFTTKGDLEVELTLVTEVLLLVLDVELPPALVLLQLVNDVELEEVEVDDVEVELMLVKEGR